MANVAGMKKASSIYSFGMNSLDRLHELHEWLFSRQFLGKAGRTLRRFHNVLWQNYSLLPWMYECTCRPWVLQTVSSLDLKDRISLDPRCLSLDLGNRFDLRLPRHQMMYCCIYDFHKMDNNLF